MPEQKVQAEHVQIHPDSRMPSYVSVYNALYADIVHGVYQENGFLPGETTLAQKYGVSRNTLRQALAILQEDGLIIKSQGKGSVVAKKSQSKQLKKVFNPMKELARHPVTHVDIQYNFNPPTDIARERLQLDTSDIVLASTNVYQAESRVIGFSFVQIPMHVLHRLEIDASSSNDMYTLIDATIFDVAIQARMDIKLVFANEMEATCLHIKEGVPLILLESILADSKGTPVARCKFYCIPEYYDLSFQV